MFSRFRIAAIFVILFIGPRPAAAQHNALWIWNTRQIIEEPVWKDTLLAVAAPLGVKTLFLYFPHTLSADGDSLSFYKEDSLKSLLRWARSHSFAVHALTGEPEWALRRNHSKPLAFVREVLRLRRETGMPDGIQFDIEPYLLLPFSLPETKPQVIRDWIDCVWKAGREIRKDSGLVYGIAVPFWMEDTISVDGIVLPIANHLCYLTDYLAVMSYRNKAEGAASVISFSEEERRWARKARRKIYMGIESQRLPGSTVHYLCETDPDLMAKRLDGVCGAYAQYAYGIRELAVRVIDGRALIGVSGGGIADSEFVRIRRGLMECFDGVPPTVSLKRVDESVRNLGKWDTLQRIQLSDSLPAIKLVFEELKQSTMYYLSPGEFRREYSLLLKHAARYPEIEGIAVHDFKSIRKLLAH